MESFKRDVPTNNFHMRPIPRGEKAMSDARDADRVLASIMQPATANQIGVVLAKLSLHCGKQNIPEEHLKFMYQDYFKDLGKYPIKLIEEACSTYRKLPDSRFMPSSGQLIAFMAEKYAKMQFMRMRIDKILGRWVEPAPKSNKQVSLDEALAKLSI